MWLEWEGMASLSNGEKKTKLKEIKDTNQTKSAWSNYLRLFSSKLKLISDSNGLAVSHLLKLVDSSCDAGEHETGTSHEAQYFCT